MKRSSGKLISMHYLKSSIFKRFIFSYIIIFVIPILLIWSFMYNNVLESLSNETINSTMNSITQTRDIVDINLQGLNYIAVQLPENKNIASMIYNQNVSSLSEYQFYVLVRELRNYRLSNAFLENIFVYFRNSDIIVGSDGKYSLDVFYNNVYRYSAMFQSDFKYILNTVNDYTYRPVEKVYDFSSYKEIITYLIPIPIIGDKYNVTLMFTIDGSSINQILENVIKSYRGVVCVFDEKNNVISTVGDRDININNDRIAEFLGGYGTNVVRQEIVNGRKQMILSTRSSKTGWGYVAILPWDQVLKKVNNIRTWAIWIIQLSVLIAMVLAYYFSYINYYPISKTANSLWSFNNGDSDKENSEPFRVSRNEFDMIERSLSQIISKNQAMENRIINQLSVVRADFFKKLLRGEYTDNNSIESMVRFVEIDPLAGPFCVIIFNIDDYDEFEEQNSKGIQSAYRFAIANVVEELSRNVGIGYTVVEDDEVILFIDFKDKDIEYDDEMFALGQKTIDFFDRNFDFTLTAGIGGIYNSLADISKSFVEANLSIDYKIVKGKNRAIVYKEIVTQKYEGSGYYYSMQNQERILNCLNIGDFEGVNQVLLAAVDNIKRRHVDINVARCIYFEIINTAMKVLEKLEPEDYNEIVLDGDILPDMVRCETLDELYNTIAEFYKIICQRIMIKKKIDNENVGNMIIKYVNDNYCDNNLTLSVISEKFGVTPAYLSRFFKNHIKYNFLEYLHQLRLKKAKKLLVQTDDNIYDIAVRCGYLDSHGLIRAFKKYENITPGKFRDSIKNGR